MGESPGRRSSSRRHHTVPRFYLKRFANADERIMRVPLGGERAPRPCGVKDVAVHNDFYSYPGDSGQLDDSVEIALSKLEGDAARVLRMVVEEDCWPLPGPERKIMAGWTAAQYLRVPARRQAANEMFDDLTKITLAVGGKPELRKRLEVESGGPVSDEEVERKWAEKTDFSSYTAKAPVLHHLASMASGIPTAADVLMQRGWVLYRFKRKALITSDHPVTLVRDPRTPTWLGVGLATAHAVVIPLDRRVALMMSTPGIPDRVKPPSAALAWDFNQRSAYSARSAVFHHPDDTPLVGVELPPKRTREMWSSHNPEDFIRPESPPGA
ncbi:MULTISPECIES: DUF4238 domain-containing protein [unclassified Streptomyces]|uniref:DUF4238 domain-containing protein n=1 Tax=unclassified Streptomyces TaxID=2593676 RepID=UPI0022789755|nr:MULTISPECIES: DUF4238 domain-containing protein [unclassified Streptomyces]